MKRLSRAAVVLAVLSCGPAACDEPLTGQPAQVRVEPDGAVLEVGDTVDVDVETSGRGRALTGHRPLDGTSG